MIIFFKNFIWHFQSKPLDGISDKNKPYYSQSYKTLLDDQVWIFTFQEENFFKNKSKHTSLKNIISNIISNTHTEKSTYMNIFIMYYSINFKRLWILFIFFIHKTVPVITFSTSHNGEIRRILCIFNVRFDSVESL